MTDYSSIVEDIETTPDHLFRPEADFWHAIVATDAQEMNDRIYVTIPEFGNLRFGPARWQSRDATSLPSRGDVALVAFNNRRELWVIAWWPFQD